ncbi:MAG TPA: TerB family tellurite resistance protein [Prolixibacteraceae bacterium]|nr:TerB family tellurite resistance protein [Prolixibacteraceae bacterium]
MSILEHFDHPERKQDKEHFKHLVDIAMADGTIEDQEHKMLNRIGKNLGLTNAEINDLIDSSKNAAYNPPYELKKRFEQMYAIVKMVLADGKIDSNEMRLATNIALKSGFTDAEIPVLLSVLIGGVRNEEDEDDLFDQYRKRVVSVQG